VFAQGTLLSRFHEPFRERDVILDLTHHTTKASKPPPTLRSLSWAGAAEWADSWLLQWHYEQPDPENGRYVIGMRVGSRQWGERYLLLHYEDGPFDAQAGRHTQNPTWRVERMDHSLATQGGGLGGADHREDIIRELIDNPWALTKTRLRDALGVSGRTLDRGLDRLIEAGHVTTVKASVPNSNGTLRRSDVLGITEDGWHRLPKAHYPELEEAWPKPPLAP
jgi:hypothetical protein